MNIEAALAWTSDSFNQAVQEHPYATIGIAAAAGYVMAGGLPTPFTRRAIRIGMRMVVVPFAASKLKLFTAPAEIHG